MDWKNRKYCGKLTASDIGETVSIMGWIDTIRDHGQLMFIHVRDVTGIVQAVTSSDQESNESLNEKLRNEYVVNITGKVTERSSETKNPNMVTGDIEITIDSITILNQAETPPFLISSKESEQNQTVDEDIRLKYRYLDLRRQNMHNNIVNRAKIMEIIREYLSRHHFLDIETPVLTKSTPEGARDYLVPSRIHQEKFYALPQSPQLFKQLLMVSGFDRYYQIVRCFRDEDLRPNRQPEFTQVDIEASFIDEEFIYQHIESLLINIFRSQNISLDSNFPRMTYHEAMDKYGNDHPDTRFEALLTSCNDIFKDTEYRIFNIILSNHGHIKGIKVPNTDNVLSKSYIQNELIKKVVPKLGGKGLTWMRIQEGELQSNIVQFLKPAEKTAIIDRFSAKEGDVLLFIADASLGTVNDILGRLRLHMGSVCKLIPDNTFSPVWVTNFPLFEKVDNHLSPLHHPFTQPDQDISKFTNDELLKVNARAYDIVMNGEEIGGGSIRIHDNATQNQIFKALNLSEEEIEEKFGFFTRSLTYGTPPHGGIALGLDRLVSMVLGTQSIREVIPFPKNRMAFCPLTEAPDKVAKEQLNDLHISTHPVLKETSSS